MAARTPMYIRSADQSFIRGAMRMPMLSAEQEIALARAWTVRSDESALHALVSCHFRLVISQAAQYARCYGLSFADLMQEGHLGLMQAAARFDSNRGVRFSTYAVWWIRAAIQDYVLRNCSVVRMGTTGADKRLFFNLRRIRGRIATASGGMGSAERSEIAALLGVSEAAVDDMDARLSGPDQSLAAPIDADGTTDWSDMLIDERPSPEAMAIEELDRRSHRRWVAQALARLPPREALIVTRRHLRERPQTLEALGAELGVSKERVRQLEKRALGKLRGMVSAADAAAIPAG